MVIISRKEAKELGLKKYFTGKLCKNGHIAERWVTGRCIECHQDFYDENSFKWQDWRAVNLEHNKEQSRQISRGWRLKDPEKMILSQIKTRCKKNNIPCSINVSHIKFPTHCPILGIKLFIGIGEGQRLDSPSVDRIIPILGYIPGNVQVISRLANNMKNAGTLEDCVKLGKWAQQLLDIKS